MKTIVAIGAYTRDEHLALSQAGNQIFYYEPNPYQIGRYDKDVRFEPYRDVNFHLIHAAVSNYNGIAVCNDPNVNDPPNNDHGGTTILASDYPKGKPCLVPILHIDEVLKAHGPRIDELALNCEGAEVAILKSVNIQLLYSTVEHITVEFHRFVPELHISQEDVLACVDHLSPYYTAVLQQEYYPGYVFTRKANL